MALDILSGPVDPHKKYWFSQRQGLLSSVPNCADKHHLLCRAEENCFYSFPPLWMIPIKHPAPLSFVELISYQKLHFIFCSDLDLDFEARGLM